MSAPPRDESLDLARATAILGMFVVHAVLVLARELPRDGLLAGLFWLCDGRAAATFVTLAGIGVARMAARLDTADLARDLRRRALFLGALGVLNLVWWPGDILRVYGVALALAPWLLRRSAAWRVALATFLVALFPVLAAALRWEERWDFATLTYRGLWEPEGFARNLIFDGFRPVVPWLAFFILGSVLATLDMRSASIRRRLLVAGGVTTAAAVTASVLLDRALAATTALSPIDRDALVGTGSLPPMPLFVLSAVGTTLLALGAAAGLTAWLPHGLVAALVATGRRALTWYLAHILVLVAVYALGRGGRLSVGASMLAAVAAFALAAAYSWWRRATPGSLETLLRRASSPPSRLPQQRPRPLT